MDKAAMVNNLIEKLGASCRIVSSTSAPGTPQSLLAQLEVLTQDRWFPIVTYEVHQHVSIRRELKSGGQWITTSIEMPAATAQVFLDNDFRTNWERYTSRILQEAPTNGK